MVAPAARVRRRGPAPPRPWLDRWLGWFALAALWPVGTLLAYLPAPLGLWLGRRLGDLAWAVLPGRRAIVVGNLSRAFGPERPPAELTDLGRRCFRHLGMTVVESCTFLFRSPAVLLSRVEFRGTEHIAAAMATGRGLLLLTAHYGNWELLAASHALERWPLSVMVRPLDSALLDPLIERLRLRCGTEIISKRQGLRGALDALRRERMVGILLDQNTSHREGVFVPFFGIPASTSRGLAVIALRTGAPVVPVFIRRLAGGRHVVQAAPPIPAPGDGDPVAFTAAFNRAIEDAIRQAPEQWFWLHRRWKTRPAAEPA
jgi:KDO2-lipid IV(A) lauroyltransferase